MSAVCPGCHEERDVDAQAALRAFEAAWIVWERLRWSGSRPGVRDIRALAENNLPNWFWACDECIARGRAVPADPYYVNIGMGTPFAAYVDRPFRCEDCGADSVFGAREQHHWFEELGFLIWVYPKQCAPCRAKRRAKARANKDLADALHNLDPADPTQLEAVARLYDEIGSPAKATADLLEQTARQREALVHLGEPVATRR